MKIPEHIAKYTWRQILIFENNLIKNKLVCQYIYASFVSSFKINSPLVHERQLAPLRRKVQSLGGSRIIRWLVAR